MSDFDRNPAVTRGYPADREIAIDQGLRAHMIRVYNYMAGGVALTGAIAWITFQFSVVTNEAGAINLRRQTTCPRAVALLLRGAAALPLSNP